MKIIIENIKEIKDGQKIGDKIFIQAKEKFIKKPDCLIMAVEKLLKGGK